MPRKRVDLRKLPVWLQYTIALAVIAVVVLAAWLTGRAAPTPTWIERGLLPALPWLLFFLVAVVVLDWIRKR